MTVSVVSKQVTAYTSSNDPIEVTSNYVLPSSSGIQGAYIDLPVRKDAVKIEFLLSGTGAQYSYPALSEIEIFAEEADDHLR
jgi:hypothetical protein